jgi:hypothetical protein
MMQGAAGTLLHRLVPAYLSAALILLLLPSETPCRAEQEIMPNDLVGVWKAKTAACEGNMWWRPTVFSIRDLGSEVYVYYEQYSKRDENDEWILHENLIPDRPVGKVYTVKDEFYYFEIELVRSYGIANKVRFYLTIDKRGSKMRGTYLRTVSFPVSQIEKAEEILGSKRKLEGSENWAPDSSGNMRELVDIVVGSCEIRFSRVKTE